MMNLTKEVIKGLPEAGKKVGGAIGKGAGQAMQIPFRGVRGMARAMADALNRAADVELKRYAPKTEAEKVERLRNIKKINELKEHYQNTRRK